MNILAVVTIPADILWILAFIMLVFIFISYYTKIKIFNFLAGMISLQLALALSDYIILLVTMLFVMIYLIYDALWSE